MFLLSYLTMTSLGEKKKLLGGQDELSVYLFHDWMNIFCRFHDIKKSQVNLILQTIDSVLLTVFNPQRRWMFPVYDVIEFPSLIKFILSMGWILS